MRRRIISCILLIIICFSSAVAYGNSGPTYWSGYPAADVMVVQENSPIEITKEILRFDFTTIGIESFTLMGEVEATYHMMNSNDKEEAVQMAFPYIGNLSDRNTKAPVPFIDGIPISYQLYLGEPIGNHQETREKAFNFASILNGITKEPYQAKHFSINEIGRQYRIKVNTKLEDGINLKVSFPFDSEKSKIISSGFNGYAGSQNEMVLSARLRNDEVLEIFVLGEDIPFDIVGYTNGEATVESTAFEHTVDVEEISFKEYFDHLIKDALPEAYAGSLAENQLYNHYARGLDRIFDQENGYFSEEHLSGLRSQDHIMTLVYDVDFAAKEEREVKVQYVASGTMDKTRTKTPLYTFDYILNPASNWAAFQDLTIEVKTPDVAPYVVKSTIPLTKNEDGIYGANLAQLPQEDFTFVLYEREKVTFFDELYGGINRQFGYLTPVVFIVVGVLGSVGIAVFIIGKKRKKLIGR